MITSQKLLEAVSDITLTNIYIVNQRANWTVLASTSNSPALRVNRDADGTMRFN